jgi:gas vesicle protein
MSQHENDLGSFLSGMIIGGLLGAAIGLLLAPQSGEETRQVIREKSIELRDKAAETAEDTRHRIEEMSQQAKEKADEIAHQVRDTIEEGREKLETTLEQGKETLQRKKTDVTEDFPGETTL